ncbi:MAG: hypothetical protein J6R82_04460 [Clostridia bacterium]|nr:hypothetical protein [Clostridia bacterium]
MSKFFSFKLYREGIKKSKLVGLTGTVITAALCALIPLVQILTPRHYGTGSTPSTSVVGVVEFAIPLLLLLPFAPLLVSTMFNYLNKRNESDFYHSIPFTRPCVYFSFLAASFTWVVIALTASLTVTSLLWLGVRYTAYSILTPIVLFTTYFLASLLLAAFMAVAMTLTGTNISNALIFVLLFGFVRLSGAFFIMALENEYPILVTALTPARLLSMDYSLPMALFNSAIGGGANIFSNYGVWIYTAILSIALIAAGCYFYTKRRSEMAGQSAPNRMLQHVYRCAITLPMAFITAFILILDGFEFTVLLVMTVLTLILYYLFEIITTKKLINCISATPYLLVVLAGGILFGVSIPVAGNVALNYTPDADEIKSISMYSQRDIYGHSGYATTYEALLIGKVEISSPEALKMVSDELTEMKKTSLASSPRQYLNPDAYLYDDMYGGYPETEKIEYKQVTLKITDKSGIVRGRTLCFTEEEYFRLQMLFTETTEYENALLSMPADKEILSIWTPAYYDDDAEATNQQLWDSFVKEYNALSLEEKVEYKSSGDYYYSELSIEITGSVGTDAFFRRYNVNAKQFPKTAKMMVEVMNRSYSYEVTNHLQLLKDNDTQSVYIDIHSNTSGTYHSVQGKAKNYLEALEFLYSCPIAEDGNGILLQISVGSDSAYSYNYYILSPDDFEAFCRKLGLDLE